MCAVLFEELRCEQQLAWDNPLLDEPINEIPKQVDGLEWMPSSFTKNGIHERRIKTQGLLECAPH